MSDFSLECSICFDAYSEARVCVTLCEEGHFVCRPCAQSLYQCPECRAPVIKRGGITNRAIMNLLRSKLIPTTAAAAAAAKAAPATATSASAAHKPAPAAAPTTSMPAPVRAPSARLVASEISGLSAWEASFSAPNVARVNAPPPSPPVYFSGFALAVRVPDAVPPISRTTTSASSRSETRRAARCTCGRDLLRRDNLTTQELRHGRCSDCGERRVRGEIYSYCEPCQYGYCKRCIPLVHDDDVPEPSIREHSGSASHSVIFQNHTERALLQTADTVVSVCCSRGHPLEKVDSRRWAPHVRGVCERCEKELKRGVRVFGKCVACVFVICYDCVTQRCPNGHEMKSVDNVPWDEIESDSCAHCDRYISEGQSCVACPQCNYSLCSQCRNIRCRNGHPMRRTDRLSPQDLDRAECSDCSSKKTRGEFYDYCELCRYGLCGDCSQEYRWQCFS